MKCEKFPNKDCNLLTCAAKRKCLWHEEKQSPRSAEEVKEIAQWLNNEKYQPEVNLWIEVAKEFHFDKPFHENAVKAITQRLIDKGFKISIQAYASEPAATTPPDAEGAEKEAINKILSDHLRDMEIEAKRFGGL